MKKSHRGQDKETKVMSIDLNLVSNCYRCHEIEAAGVHFFSLSLRFGLFAIDRYKWVFHSYALILIICVASMRQFQNQIEEINSFFLNSSFVLFCFSFLIFLGLVFIFRGCFAIWTAVSIWHHTILHENLYARIKFELREASLQFSNRHNQWNSIEALPIEQHNGITHVEAKSIQRHSIDCATMNQTQFEML